LFNSEVSVGNRKVGQSNPVFTVAEIGVNHFGDISEGKYLIDLALDAGFDSVKFQLYDVDYLYASNYLYWKNRLREKQLSIEQLLILHTYAEKKGIFSFCTPHDSKSLQELEHFIEPSVYKVGSGERRNFPFIREVCSLGKPVILSTGMYSQEDIIDTLDVIQDCGVSDLILLHCVSSYPIPDNEVNLSAITQMRSYFPGVIGYSDHTVGNLACLAAVALGAKVIEKHITRRTNVANAQDWKVSATPHDICDLVEGIRKVEAQLGDGKKPSICELESVEWAQKSLAYLCDFKRDTIIESTDLISVRPGSGIRPDQMHEFIGQKLTRDVEAFSLLSPDDFYQRV
jgi:N,N'-diacetyllegionaminate synthase